MTDFKHPLTLSEQLTYIENTKNITFNNVSKEEAKDYLYTHSYMNVITPYKKNMYLKDSNNKPILINNHHMYPNKHEFSEFVWNYESEHYDRIHIFKNILKFETTFNSILTYEVMQHYKIDSENNLATMINELDNHSHNFIENKPYTLAAINHMQRFTKSMYKEIKKYDDIFVYFDRLTLKQLIMFYRCLSLKLQNKIYINLKRNGLTFGYDNPNSFEEFISRIPSIRNCICHGNNLEILLNFSDVSKMKTRTSTDRKTYMKIINSLLQR